MASSSSSSSSSSSPLTPSPISAVPRRDPTKCSICVESFTPFPGEHIPLLLPCGHCFCSGCVAFFEKRDCPECRTKMGRKDLPRNFALLDMIASMSTMATVQPGAGEKRKRMGEYSATELFALAEEKKEEEAFVERKEVLVAALSQALDELVKANDRAALETRVTALRDEMIRTISDQAELASDMHNAKLQKQEQAQGQTMQVSLDAESDAADAAAAAADDDATTPTAAVASAATPTAAAATAAPFAAVKAKSRSKGLTDGSIVDRECIVLRHFKDDVLATMVDKKWNSKLELDKNGDLIFLCKANPKAPGCMGFHKSWQVTPKRLKMASANSGFLQYKLKSNCSRCGHSIYSTTMDLEQWPLPGHEEMATKVEA